MGEKRATSRRDLLGLGLGAVGASVLSAARSEAEALSTGPVRAYRDAASRRRVLYSLLGDLPDRDRPLSARVRSQEERDGYLLETLELDLNGIETAPAYLARPRAAKGRLPAVLYNHSHGGGYTIGKKELLEGREYLQKPPYAKPLTDAGYVVLCIDHWVFGERSHTTEADTFKAMIWQGQVLWGMMVYDSLRAMDYLVSRPDVDASRVATLGMSMGSTMAFWLAALDERVKVTVDICCQTEFHTLVAKKGLSGHGIYYYVPSLLKHFTTSDIDALIAPRPHLALAGLQDKLTPVEGLDVIDREMKAVYADVGHPERWKMLRYDVGHQETPEGRKEVLAFLQAWL
jgi:alpha/beta hydrolase family protein